MSFGFGVGDIITVLGLANSLRQGFRDAPEQFSAISAEVRSLLIILKAVDNKLSEWDLTREKAEIAKSLREIAGRCREAREILDRTFENYQELSPNHKDSKPKDKILRVWKRVKWKPDDISALQNDITRSISMLNAFYGQITSEGVDRLNKRQDDQDRIAIIDWLTPIDYGKQQSDLIARRQEGTL